MTIELCENCGGSIGKLETPMLWNDQILCAVCYRKLNASSVATIAPPQLLARHVVEIVPIAPTVRRRGAMFWVGISIMIFSVAAFCCMGPFALIVTVIGLLIVILDAVK